MIKGIVIKMSFYCDSFFCTLEVVIQDNFYYICNMKREIIAFGDYYDDFMKSLSPAERKKIHYIIDLLITEDRISSKFVKFIRDGLYELRAMYNGNIYRIFFIFDNGKIVVLFNGFQKKTQKTPENEIKLALKIKEEYYGSKED